MAGLSTREELRISENNADERTGDPRIGGISMKEEKRSLSGVETTRAPRTDVNRDAAEIGRNNTVGSALNVRSMGKGRKQHRKGKR